VPVLAVEAVKAAASVENSEIRVPAFSSTVVRIFWVSRSCASWAEPPCHAVRGQRIIIPLEDAPSHCASFADQSTANVEDQTAKAFPADADFAVVSAHAAGNTFWVVGRFRW